MSKHDAATVKVVLDYAKAGISNRQASRDLGIPESTIRNIRARAAESGRAEITFHDKKVGGFNWRDALPAIQGLQELRHKASWSQDYAKITVGDGSQPIAVMFLADTHIGSINTDYTMFVELTDMILNTPNLYFALLGDEVEMAIKLRSVAETCAQILDPDMQAKFIESWLEEILPKLLFCTWSNHSTERGEKLAGSCTIKNILARRAPFFSGIGHADLVVGSETYKLAVSHKFKGVTQADATAGCKRYLRVEYNEGEIAVQGDSHRFGISQYNEGGKYRIAMCTGTLHVSSGFAKRYFSLKTSTAFPVLQLWPNKHLAIPYRTIAEYLNSRGEDSPVHTGI